jgi:hypothetical protein
MGEEGLRAAVGLSWRSRSPAATVRIPDGRRRAGARASCPRVSCNGEHPSALGLAENAGQRRALAKVSHLGGVPAGQPRDLRRRLSEDLLPSQGIARIYLGLRVPPHQSVPSVPDDLLVQTLRNRTVIDEAAQLGATMPAALATAIDIWEQRGRVQALRLGASLVQHGGERMAVAWVCPAVLAHTFDQRYEPAQWHLAATGRSQEDRNVTRRDPAIERGLTHFEQTRRESSGDCQARHALQVRSHGCDVLLRWRRLLGPAQLDDVADQPLHTGSPARAGWAPQLVYA